MAAEGIHRLEVAAIVAFPDAMETADLLIRYDGRVTDRTFIVYVVADSEPPMVITVSVRRPVWNLFQ